MRIPGFTAEASLYSIKCRYYRQSASATQSAAAAVDYLRRVSPALPPVEPREGEQTFGGCVGDCMDFCHGDLRDCRSYCNDICRSSSWGGPGSGPNPHRDLS